MADRLDIEVTGFEFLSQIERAASTLEEPGRLLSALGASMESLIAQRFITKVDPNGRPWAPLAPKTLKRKDGRGSILELSGLGKKSVGYIIGLGQNFVEVGFGESYMGWHETGTQRMPRRQLLTDDWVSGTLGRDDQAELLATVEDFLNSLDLN